MKSKGPLFAGVAVMGIGTALLIHLGLWPKPVQITELKFPVLVIRQNESAVTVCNNAVEMQTSKMYSNDPPQDGNVVIDSDFNLFTQQHTECEQGDMGMLFRTFVRPGKPLTFKFDFRRMRNSGIAVAREHLQRCASLGGAAADLDRKRKEISTQTTMADIITVLQSEAP